MSPLVSVLIVTYNSGAVLPACLDSLATNTRLPYEIIMVDNASQDNTLALVRTRYPQITLIENKQNVGFAAAVNQAARIARGRLFLLLNPDTAAHPGAIDELVHCLDVHPGAAVCAPRLLRADGRLRYNCFPFYSPQDMYWDAIARGPLSRLRRFKRALNWRPEVDSVQPVEAAVGAALLIRAGVYRQLNGLDERFFLYCEDADFCLRVHQAGYSVLYTPQAVVTHLGGHSLPANEVYLDAMLGRRLLESYYKYLDKHAGRSAACGLRLINGLAASLYGVGALLKTEAAARKQHLEKARLLLLTPVAEKNQC